MIVSTTADRHQLAVTGITDVIGPDSVYRGDERVGAATALAERDALSWIGTQRRPETDQGD